MNRFVAVKALMATSSLLRSSARKKNFSVSAHEALQAVTGGSQRHSGIWAYIAADSPRGARKVRLQIHEARQKLAENPRLGHSREDLTELPVLVWSGGSYLIVNDPELKPPEIVRVLHGAQTSRIFC